MDPIDDLSKTTFSGRRFTRKQLARVRETVQLFANLSRKELALTVCEHLDWRTPGGKLKVLPCVKLLEALEGHGVITLPAKRVTKAPVRKVPRFEERPDDRPVEGALGAVTPVSLRIVTRAEDRERWKAYVHTYHYLGHKQLVGSQLGYFIVSEARQQELGCLAFSGSASWALAARDKWIGWDAEHRERLLHLILCNDRFLIFPWVQVPHLASHVLSVAVKQVADDWVGVYGYRPALIETYVDPTRYSGACYRAANWQHLGQTHGRGRGERRHERVPRKDIYVMPVHRNWRESLTQGYRKADLKKRYRNDLASAHQRSVGDDFVALWKQVAGILHEVAAEYDEKWRVRKRVIDSLLLMLLIFRLVTSKNSQGYGTTIDDLWDSCKRLDLPLPQKSSIAPSSFCTARRKLDESIFKTVNTRILEAYAPQRALDTWRGHRLFAVDGSKINLPRALVKDGYRLPSDKAHYPQGLLSCLYEIRSQIPFDFDLVARDGERVCALRHSQTLQENDVVVYDRGYFSYPMLHHHIQSGIHAVFRLQESSSSEIEKFVASDDAERIATILPSDSGRTKIRQKYPHLEIVPLKLRLMKYEVQGSQYCIGTTLTEPEQRYPLRDFMDVYHSRWGVEEMYKVSKRIMVIEDFHAKTERGVKQELFAHFALITMNRLFANQSDLDLNASDPTETSHDPRPAQPDSAVTRRVQTNLKNCIHVLERHLEQLVLLKSRVKAVIQSVFDAVTRRHQTVRPGRSYPRRSMRPINKWQESSRKKRKARAAAASAA